MGNKNALTIHESLQQFYNLNLQKIELESNVYNDSIVVLSSWTKNENFQVIFLLDYTNRTEIRNEEEQRESIKTLSVLKESLEREGGVLFGDIVKTFQDDDELTKGLDDQISDYFLDLIRIGTVKISIRDELMDIIYCSY